MREIQASMITDTIERLCIEANQVLPDDIKKSIQTCRSCEDGQIACGILDNIIENYEIAEKNKAMVLSLRSRVSIPSRKSYQSS